MRARRSRPSRAPLTTRRRPAALKSPVLGPGEPSRLLSPSQRTRMRARRSRPSRAPLTTRRRPAALKSAVLGPGEPRRPLSPSHRTRMRASRSRPSRAPLTTRRRPTALVAPVLGPGEPRRPLSTFSARCCGPAGGARPRARRPEPFAVAVSPPVHAGPRLRAEPGRRPAAQEAPVLGPGVPRRPLSTSRRTLSPDAGPRGPTSLGGRPAALAAPVLGPGDPSSSPPPSRRRCMRVRGSGLSWAPLTALQSPRRSGGACPRAGRPEPFAVAVSPQVHAGPPLRDEPGPAVYSGRRPATLEAPVLGPGDPGQPLATSRRMLLQARRSRLSRAPLSTPAVVPPPWRRPSSGRASRSDCYRRLAARLLRACRSGLCRAPLSTPAVVPPPWRRLSSGRATRAVRCRRRAAGVCGSAAPG
jgi:hypothetical protein